MYLLDNILEAFFGTLGGVDFFYFSLSLMIIAVIVAALVRPFIGDV